MTGRGPCRSDGEGGMQEYGHSPGKSRLPHGSHHACHQHPSLPYEKNPSLSFPTFVIGNPEFFLARLFLHWASDNDSKVMLAWSRNRTP